jgi:hypothetical protein
MTGFWYWTQRGETLFGMSAPYARGCATWIKAVADVGACLPPKPMGHKKHTGIALMGQRRKYHDKYGRRSLSNRPEKWGG